MVWVTAILLLALPIMDSVPFSILSSISQRGLQSVDYIVVLVYFVGTLAAGIYFSRQQHEGEDFFVAGRSMPWFAVGLSLIASLMSSTTYLAALGRSAAIWIDVDIRLAGVAVGFLGRQSLVDSVLYEVEYNEYL